MPPAPGGFKGQAGGGGSSSRLAERSADAGDYQTAEALYRQAFQADPNSIEALVGLGRSYAGMGQYARAEQALNEANRRKPKDPDVLLELARTQLGAGQAQGALNNLDIAVAKRPRDVSLITARGIALDRLSRHAEAQATYREGLKRDPTDFALNSNLGLSLGLSGQTDAGIAILRELVRDGSANANTRGNLALVYGLAGREGDAKATLQRDLSSSAIQNNLAYYRELRGLLLKGKPIGNLGQPLQGTRPAAKPPAAVVASAAPAGAASGVGAPLSGVDPLSAIAPVTPAIPGAACRGQAERAVQADRNRAAGASRHALGDGSRHAPEASPCRHGAGPVPGRSRQTRRAGSGFHAGLGRLLLRHRRPRHADQEARARAVRLTGAGRDLQRGSSRKTGYCPIPMKLSMMSRMAGPISTMNRAGRMNSIMGTVIVAGSRPAFSSARSMRSVRCSWLSTLKARASGVPYFSAWIIVLTKPLIDGIGARSTRFSSA